jgi:hypothetical protein
LLCSRGQTQAPLPLEDLETTSTIPSRLDRGVHSDRNSPYDHAVGDPFRAVRDDHSSASGRDPASSVITLLPFIYVPFAAGVALTKHRYVTLTTTRIRYASRLMSSSEPERAAGTIAVCLLFASIGCASFALQPPPAFLVATNWHLGCYAAAPILWSALISVAVASFGANSHAAADAFDF